MDALGEKMCELRITDSADMFLAKINGVIRQNIVAIVVCLLIVCVSLLVVWVVVKSAFDVWHGYRLHLGKTMSKPPPLPQPSGGVKSFWSSGSKKSDDIVYKGDDDNGGGLASDIPVEPEATKIASKMAAIKSQYSAYNRAISAYVVNKDADSKPDDLMDEGIMSRKGDDFHYGKDLHKRVIHHDDGLN